MSSKRIAAVTILLTLAGLFATARGAAAQKPAQNPVQPPVQSAPQPPKPADNNAFPEDTSNIPVVPANGSIPAPDAASSAALPALPTEEADPVRAPGDEPESVSASGSTGDSSSSSSLAGMPPPPADDSASADTTGSNVTKQEKQERKASRIPGILNRNKPPAPAKHEETAKEDLSVGDYYLSTHNWKGAVSRYQSAMVLSPDDPNVYWGLAEAQRNLGDFASAKANYEKLLDYDPNNKHAKEAKKLLNEPALANVH